MGALPLFQNLRTTDDLLDSVNRLANKKMGDFVLTTSAVKNKAHHHSTVVSIVGTTTAHEFVKKDIRCDSLPQGLYMLEEFLTTIPL